MRDTSPISVPLSARRVLWVLVALGLTGACRTPSSRIELPPCVDEISVSGQHSRSGRTALILDHSFDFPGTSTQVTLERGDKTRTVEIVNSVPDWWRLLGGSIVGLTGAGLLGRYSYGVAVGEDPVATPWLWALPCGTLALGAGALLATTGWHPSGDTIIEGQCREPAPTR